MTMTENDGGGGGVITGTAGSICAISPTDLVGTIGNLISRIEELERALSNVLGADFFTEQLSNLSSQVGWVYGVEYMGTPGWIQTSYGTLIPPPGFTLSGSGFTLTNACTGEESTYQGVLMDENGVLQFGFTDVGEMCGEMVETWNNGSQADYYIYGKDDHSGPPSVDPTQMDGSGITLVTDDIDTIQQLKPLNTATFRVSQDGVYHITATGTGQVNNTSGAAYPYMSLNIRGYADGGNEQVNDTVLFWENPDQDFRTSGTISVGARLRAEDNIEINMNVGLYGGGTAVYRFLTNARISIIWVAPLGD